jgi:osomolarity two-component system, sensor histidine kinase TcsA
MKLSTAELMGGHIGYRPREEGHGSIFWFTAKLKKVKLPDHIGTVQERLEAIAVSGPASPFEDIRLAAMEKRVLLAEDNPINQKVMIKTLASLGFDKVDLANDGKEAVTMAFTASRAYDIILMDINMPILDGVSATREIRLAGINTPIIAMTANALKGQAEAYIAKGMTDYVSKPVDRKKLVAILLSCLKKDETLQPLDLAA